MNIESQRKPRVVFEQYVIPHYRVPFFAALAKEVDLVVVASKDKEVDGLNNVKGDLPFRTAYLEQKRETGLFHPDIFDIIKEHKADVLISFGTSLELMLNNRTARKEIRDPGLKIMAMGCDGYMVRHFRLHLAAMLLNPFSIRRTIRSLISRSRTDFFLPHASHNAEYLRFSRLVPKRKIRVVGNAIDTSILNSAYKEEVTKGTTRDTRRVIFTGRLSPGKRVDVLIKAFSKAAKKYPDARLDIVGDGSERTKLEALAAKLKLTDSIKFLGPVYDDRVMAEHLARASLFVMPSLGGLGFNTAMAAALPVVYTDADGTEKDLFQNGVNGWYFNGTERDLANKLLSALAHPEKLAGMGKISEDLIMNRFNLKNMVDVYVKSIRQVIENKNEKTA